MPHDSAGNGKQLKICILKTGVPGSLLSFGSNDDVDDMVLLMMILVTDILLIFGHFFL